jgi:hypothetical protein
MKVSRSNAVVFLFSVIGCLGGCVTQTGFKKPILPDDCFWVEIPNVWICFPQRKPPDDGASTAIPHALRYCSLGVVPREGECEAL